jgi:Rrf2 family protein
MLSLPSKTLYALEAVVDIAYNARPNPVRSQDITRRQGIPSRYLEPVLQQLVRAGILRGVRGPRGGYRLARERRRISIGEVIRVVAGAEGGGEPLEGSQSPFGRLVVQPLWRELEQDLLARLESITIEDLCRRAEAAEVPGQQEEKADFRI